MFARFARFDSCGEVRNAVIGGMFYRRTNGRQVFGHAETTNRGRIPSILESFIDANQINKNLLLSFSVGFSPVR
jgi:hypothetical protein